MHQTSNKPAKPWPVKVTPATTTMDLDEFKLKKLELNVDAARNAKAAHQHFVDYIEAKCKDVKQEQERLVRETELAQEELTAFRSIGTARPHLLSLPTEIRYMIWRECRIGVLRDLCKPVPYHKDFRKQYLISVSRLAATCRLLQFDMLSFANAEHSFFKSQGVPWVLFLEKPAEAGPDEVKAYELSLQHTANHDCLERLEKRIHNFGTNVPASLPA